MQHLERFGLLATLQVDEFVPTMTPFLQSHPTIKDLTINCVDLKYQSSIELLRILSHNAILQKLVLFIEGRGSEDEACLYGTPIGGFFRDNNSIQHVKLMLAVHQSSLQENAAVMMRGLEQNYNETSLSHLVLDFCFRGLTVDVMPKDVSDAFVTPLENLLSNNSTLTSVVLETFSEVPEFMNTRTTARAIVELGDNVNFYLKLNQAGRKQVLLQTARELWSDIVIRYRDDVRISFYFLAMNPSLCDNTNYRQHDNSHDIGEEGRRRASIKRKRE
jgi:hypothetical protein